MANYKAKSLFSHFRMSFVSRCSQSKVRLILLSIVVLSCFIAGIIIFASNPYSYPGDEYLLSFEGVGNGFGAFFSRTLSLTVVTGIVFVFSLNKWLFPFGAAVIGFRGYLLGFNISVLCSGFGMSGLLDAIFIVIPCQLCMLAVLVLLFAFLTKARALCDYGKGGRGRMLLILWLVLVALNIIETLLLCIFSSKVILVI